MINLIFRLIVSFQAVSPYSVFTFTKIKPILFLQLLADLDIPITVVLVTDGASIVIYTIENNVNMWMLLVFMPAMIYWVSLIPIFCIYSFARLTSISSVILEASSGA